MKIKRLDDRYWISKDGVSLSNLNNILKPKPSTWNPKELTREELRCLL